MTYVLTAVKFRHNVAYNDKGQPTEVKIYRQGDVVDDLPAEHLERLLQAGAIAHPADEVVEPVDVEVPDSGDTMPADEMVEPVESERPKNTATKKAWVDYAVAVKGWGREDAEALDKTELIEALG